MLNRHRFPKLYRLLVAILILFALELASGYWLTHLASPAQFDRFASEEQRLARYGDPGLTPHRYFGYYGKPYWQNGSDQHNALGYRGEEIDTPKPGGIFRIVCVGGSETYGAGVNDFRASYPFLLEETLQARGFSNVEVINAGVIGYQTWESLLDLQFRIIELDPDLIIIYHNAADIASRLVWPPTAYRGDNTGFDHTPLAHTPSLLERSHALRIILTSLGQMHPPDSQTQTWSPRAKTSYDLLFAEQWQAGTYPQGFFNQVPVATMLNENPPVYFERNLRNMLTTAQINQIAVMLTTFAYSPEFSQNHQTSPPYQTALNEHNQLLQTLSETKQVPLFDLAQQISQTPAYFTDGLNFSAEGNKTVAQLMAEYLLEHHLITK